MAQSNAVRDEPSMEDILSSIRRIIASNDSENTPANAEHSPVSQPVPPLAQKQPFVQKNTEDPVSAPIISRIQDVKPAIRNDLPQSATAEGELINPPTRSHAMKPDQELAMPISAPRPINADASARVVAPVNAAPMPQKTSNTIADHENAIPRSIQNASLLDNAAPNTFEPNIGTSLISSGAETKVSAAFAQLNDVVSAEASRNLEGIATEMLQPMLQEWLDNNLPNLVERLVREEIARVARGD